MQELIKSSLNYIEQNLKTDITAEELAQIAGYSVRHYCRLFKTLTGSSVANYILKRRLEYALAEIISSWRKATDVVLEYGFYTYAGFYKAFLKVYGCSPTKYLSAYKTSQKSEVLMMYNEKDIQKIVDYNKIAEEAAKAYSIDIKSIDFIEKGRETEFAIHNCTMSYTYKITDNKNNCYNLRLHEFTNWGNKYDAATEKAIINSELEWVAAIGRDTDILVPEPIKSVHGEYAVVVDGVYCLLTKCLEGDWKRHILSLASNCNNMDEYGDRQEGESLIKTIGKLHKHASEWKIPAGFIRPSYEADNISKVFAVIDAIPNDFSMPNGTVYKKDLEIIKSAGQKAIKRMETIEKNNMTWGLIHANLLHCNFHIINRNMYPIQYSEAVFGYYMMDIARAFFFVAPEKREYFLDLYSKYFPLPKDYVSQIETFFITRWLEICYHHIKELDEWLPQDMSTLASREFGYYLNDEPFLFNKPAFFQ